MLKKILILIIAVSTNVITFGKQNSANALLRDGISINGIDGKLIVSDNNSTYYFKLDSPLNDDKTTIEKGANIKLLPSTALEKMRVNIKQDQKTDFRIWGKVTAYKGKNYFFVDNFLPVSEIKSDNTSKLLDNATAAADKNNELKLPPDILEKLTTRKVIRPAQLQKGLKFEQDHILVDATGFIIKQPDGSLIFSYDAIGRNIEKISIPLLACQALEDAWQKQSAEPERIRFKMAGIVTKFNGNYYMLLQRAYRVYSHGNFTR